jgi:hypothetical protein
MQAIWSDLQAAGVDLVLVGHDHHYERFAPQDAAGRANAKGPREFIVGTGGANHGSPSGTVAANSQARNYTVFGVLRLTLAPGGYDWRFVPEAGKSFSDAGHGVCH